MTASSSFLTGSDLDELFELIDGGYLDNDEEISKELETFVSELPSDEKFLQGYVCNHCNKVCKSSRGLTRHTKSKHVVHIPFSSPSSAESKQLLTDEEKSLKKLHPLHLKVILEKCAEKLTTNLCYPEKLRIKFLNFCFSNDDAVELWSKLRVVSDIFQGDAENLIPHSLV